MNETEILFKAKSQKKKVKDFYENKQWYTVRSLLGNTWARYYILIGARERGKSYSVQEYCLNQWFRTKKPFYWMPRTHGLLAVVRDKGVRDKH